MSSEDSTLATRFGLATLESRRSTALLGIRFWDQALDVQVRDGLVVTLQPADREGPVRRAVLGPSGIYSFHDIPGLRALEYPSGSTTPAVQRDFLLQVADEQGRFQPVATKVTLPDTGSGLFLSSLTATVAGEGAPAFYLFAAPTRQAGAGLAAVRAELWDRVADAPAAYAVLEVQHGSRTWYGVADRRGCAAVVLPYPVAQGGLDTPATPLPELTWPLTVRVRYGFSALAPPAGAEIPDLREIIGQPRASICTVAEDPGASATSEWERTLHYGQELILRTGDLPRLLIQI